MHKVRHASKLFRPLLLSTIISHAIWSGSSIAENIELDYSANSISPASVKLSDAISGDGNYTAKVNIDNPNTPLSLVWQLIKIMRFQSIISVSTIA